MRSSALWILCFVAALASAQSRQPASDPPENSLAAITLAGSSIPAVEVLYGKPSIITKLSAATVYEWQRLTYVLDVTVLPISPPAHPTATPAIVRIRIKGEGDPANKRTNRTGRGLKLGDKPSEIGKIYGVKPERPVTRVEWKDGTALRVHVSDRDRIDEIDLSAPGASDRDSACRTVRPGRCPSPA